MGFRSPILLLPEKAYSENVLKFIFIHECHHIRQRDTLYKLFWLLMQSLLWFQPLIYLLAALGGRDVEVACDEAVVEGRDMEARKEYGYALLLKGLSKLTKKGELQSGIERINERIDLLKVGLSGIAKRYGYQTVQDFYRAYHTAKNAYADYQEKATKWEETYGTKAMRDTLHSRIQSYQREQSARQSERATQRKGRGAR